MTKAEFKESKEYREMIDKIKGYPQGFTFTLDYTKIPKAKANALIVVTDDCKKMGILESTQFGLDLQGNFTDETFRRL